MKESRDEERRFHAKFLLEEKRTYRLKNGREIFARIAPA